MLVTYDWKRLKSAAPTLWNTLPSDIKNSSSVSLFKHKLKTFLLKKAFLWLFSDIFYFYFISLKAFLITILQFFNICQVFLIFLTVKRFWTFRILALYYYYYYIIFIIIIIILLLLYYYYYYYYIIIIIIILLLLLLLLL